MSHFPDIDTLDSGDIVIDHHEVELDPSADSLIAREQALLGSDAQMFDKTHLQSPSQTESYPFSAHGMNEVGPGVFSAYTPGQQSSPFGTTVQQGQNEEQEMEPQVIKEWRERQALQIQKRDEASESKKQREIEAAHQAIDDFYENYNSKKERAIEQARKEEAEATALKESQAYGGSTWEQILRLIDPSDKAGRGVCDTSRFRQVLQSLSENPPVLKGE